MTAVQKDHTHQLVSSRDLDHLIRDIGKARIVLLGEASHGTHEYYTWRTAISKRLIEEHGFSIIAVEGDWPDCYEINRYIKDYKNTDSASTSVLRKFRRWPTWMWGNWEIAALVDWMHTFNGRQPADKRVGFYGLDIYSLWESLEVIVDYLKREDPKSAQLALDALRCFEPYTEGHDYARAILNLSPHCRREVVTLLKSVSARAQHYDHDPEASLNAEMNARVIAHAEEYYRAMISFRDESWN